MPIPCRGKFSAPARSAHIWYCTAAGELTTEINDVFSAPAHVAGVTACLEWSELSSPDWYPLGCNYNKKPW
ncbi:hypothetical protein ACQP2X_17310 [Actinoplanes sp. CA-131856]